MGELLKGVLLTILQPQYHPTVDEWLRTATPNDRKGVKMMGAIYKHKGQKKFRNAQTSGSSAVNLKTAAHELQKRTFTSTYESEFAVASQTRPSTAILARTRFGDLPCSSTLTPVAVRFIENWIALKDAEDYRETVMETLRALLAYFNSAKKATTESKRQYVWNDPTKLMKAHRIDHLNNRSVLSRNASIGRPWVVPKTAEQQDVSIKANTFSAEDLRKRREALIKGSGQVATWIVGPQDMLSNYQNTYVTHFNKYQRAPTPDFHTSLSLGRMVPNPDSLPQH